MASAEERRRAAHPDLGPTVKPNMDPGAAGRQAAERAASQGQREREQQFNRPIGPKD